MTAAAQARELQATTPRALAAGSNDAVGKLWAASWSQLRAAFPAIEDHLAELESTRPTRFRALARLEASAARASGRVLRGTASPAELLRKLLLWEAAILAEVQK